MIIQNVDLQGLIWPKGASARVWFCQPQGALTPVPPYLPTLPALSLDLLRAVLAKDDQLGAPDGGAPSIILLPELSVHPDQIVVVRQLLRTARQNTLLICGIGHMRSDQLNAIEPNAKLCGDPVAGSYANCALIGCGGTDQIFLQPKVVPSREELDFHWPGRVIRYFCGRSFAFVVFICSEMLNRAAERTTISQVLDRLDEENHRLSAVFWLQHNRRPRSADFLTSLDLLMKHRDRPMTFVAGSRNECPPRFENFGVSGALLQRAVVPTHFNVLTRQFHYVEPVRDLAGLSRVVLLRYDVDVNVVDTVLANAIGDEDRTQRSQLFKSVKPFIMQDNALVETLENTHLVQILKRGRDRAIATDIRQKDRIHALTDQLVALGTPAFQDFLDRAILPRPRNASHRHAAGQPHPNGDCFCDCWQHRECIDFLCDDIDFLRDDQDAAVPIAHLLLALARIVAQGLNVSLLTTSSSSTNIRVSLGAGEFSLCIVFPFSFDADATTTGIRGNGRPKAADDVSYIILGTMGRSGRPPLAQIDQAVPMQVGPLQAGSQASPLLRAVYGEDFNASCAAGTLFNLLQRKFG